MAIIDSIKDILSLKVKQRHDTYSDQYTRIFMVKIMMIGSILVGLNWYSDNINCVLPESIGAPGGFVKSACWINGLYVYEKIRYHVDEVGYFGIPREIRNDGMFPDGSLCNSQDETTILHSPVKCEPLKKTFFLQYQYMTFVLAALALLYYAPYGLFRAINVDMVSLKGSLEEPNADDIVRNYFNHHVKSATKLQLRVFGNIVIKVIYIVCNIVAFAILDGILNGNFATYGSMWITWAKLDNQLAYDYMGVRHSPKPGNVLLPSFALCEVQESAKDIKVKVINKHKFVCELSQHILYQYVFIVVWFAMVFGIVVSVVGLLAKLIEHVITIACFQKTDRQARRMYAELTLREVEYLEYIRQKNMPIYNEIIAKLKGDFTDDIKKPYYQNH